MFQQAGLQRFRPGAEGIIFAGLFALAFAYLCTWPQLLGIADESHFLYHARQILAGKVLYRDLFEFYTPLSFYLMALAFALFGVKLATAKIFIALVHAMTVGLIFKAARRAAARRSLAVAAAIAYLAIGPPAWPYASPHWIASCLLALLLFLLLQTSLERRTLLGLGFATGALTSMQQQTGVPIALGIGVAIVAEALLDARAGRMPSFRVVIVRLCWFAVPAVGLTMFILLLSMFRSGPMPMFEQLVLHPLTGYRPNIHTTWGSIAFITQWLSKFTVPRVLSLFAPVLLSISVVRLIVAWRTRERGAFGVLPAQTIFLLFTVAAVLYFPDFIHLAFVSPVFLILSAESTEWGLRQLETRARIPLLGLALSILLTLFSLGKMADNFGGLHARFNINQETRFGPVSFDSPERQKLFLDVDAELARDPDRTLFCYPSYGSMYLMTAADNPIRHMLMLPDYLAKAHYDEAFEILETLPVQTIVIANGLLDPKSDPMLRYIKRKYRCVDEEKPCSLYRRKERWR